MEDLTIVELSQFLTVVGAAIGAVVGVVLYIKRWIQHQVQEANDTVQRELRPNHGSSMKDQLARVEALLTDLSRRFDEHLEKGDR